MMVLHELPIFFECDCEFVLFQLSKSFRITSMRSSVPELVYHLLLCDLPPKTWPVWHGGLIDGIAAPH